ncbi:RHS repeat-associated core domain-containing protein [Pseudomonas sp. RA_35y_Pfl2_P32]|uniref:RHS repeat-associated core domain-containing protein n=1 Tax=Pseudomonas sp. RA_35y_Pfl2_P32 TaxID=3088705 RepID=UPI0030D7C6D6
MTHTHTPVIVVIDPRTRPVRAVSYHRRAAHDPAQACISQQTHDAAGRAVLSRDPRLFLLHQAGQATASQQNVYSMSGTVLLSVNNDAGWRLGLIAAHGPGVEGWDQKLSHSRIEYDPQCRPVSTFEHEIGEPATCTSRLAYADGHADADHNRRGQLVRHDDTAGTLHVTEFGLNGAPLHHSRTFLADPLWPVNWPLDPAQREVFLEPEPAVTQFLYNAVGEPVHQTDALGNRQRFIHTRAGQLKEVRLKLRGANEAPLVSAIHYNAAGQIEHQRAQNGVISCATYGTEDGRLEHLKAYVPGQPALQDLSYQYDATGNILCISDASQAQHFQRNQRIEACTRYRYDSLYRLIESCGRQLHNAPGGPQLPPFQCAPDPGQMENYCQTFTYDVAGNLLVLQHQAGSASRTERTAVARLSNRSLPAKATGQLPDEQEIAAGYDLNGNRTRLQPGQGLSWDRRNQLSQVDQVVREDAPNDGETYQYANDGQRLRKIRRSATARGSNTHETRYLPGIETRTSANETLHVITVEAGRGTVQVLHWAKGKPPSITQDQQRYSFTDHLNSSLIELDSAAQVISRESYYPYGGTCWWAGRNQIEASYKTTRYSGKERDATGMYYYGHRYYLPWAQRWLNADPAGTADGLNLYAMVHGNPVGHVDINGLATTRWQTAAAAGATFLRDAWSAGLGGLVRYGASIAVRTLATTPGDDPETPTVNATANLVVTGVGMVAGAAAWGSMGAGAGANVAARYSNNPAVIRSAAALGSGAGMVAGAAPALIAYLLAPNELNTVAISILTAPLGGGAREINQRALANLGPRIDLPPSGRAILARTTAYTALLAVNGAASAAIAPLAGIAADALTEGADGASITVINSLFGGTHHPGTNSLSGAKASEIAYGTLTRAAGSTVTAGLGMPTTAIEPPVAASILASIAAAPTEYRTYLGRHVLQGASTLFNHEQLDFKPDAYTPGMNLSPQAGYHPEMPARGNIELQAMTRDGSFRHRRASV